MTPPDRRNIATGTAGLRLYVVLAVAVCAMTIASVIVLTLTQPGRDHSQTFALIGTITGPLMTALLAAGLHGIGTSLDGRMTQLLQATAEKEHVKGVVEGLIANPQIPITEDVVPPLTKGRSE